MLYAYTIFYVDKVVETILFYEQAFGFARKFITPEKDYGELISGETTLAFASHDLGKANFSKGYEAVTKTPRPVGIEIAFTTENIETDFKKALDAGAELFEPIKEKPWGQKVGYLRDPNGILIEICTPIKN